MKFKRFRTLLAPSLLSGSLTIVISVAILLGATWSYRTGSGVIYDFLFGRNSSEELIRTSQSAVSAFTSTIFDNSILNKVLYFAFWLLVGLMVYIVLYLLIRGTSSAVEDAREATYTNIQKQEVARSLGLRLGLHLLVAAGWAIYWVFFVKILFPFSILATRSGLSQLPHAIGWIYSPLGLVIMAVSIHMHVVFLRLLVLRVRLYGSNT